MMWKICVKNDSGQKKKNKKKLEKERKISKTKTKQIVEMKIVNNEKPTYSMEPSPIFSTFFPSFGDFGITRKPM